MSVQDVQIAVRGLWTNIFPALCSIFLVPTLFLTLKAAGSLPVIPVSRSSRLLGDMRYFQSLRRGTRSSKSNDTGLPCWQEVWRNPWFKTEKSRDRELELICRHAQ